MKGSKAGDHRGFTLVELLTVVGIVAVFASVLFTALSQARRKTRNVQCLGNVRQLSVGLSQFVSQNGAYPLHINAGAREGVNPEHRTSWMGSITEEGLAAASGATGEHLFSKGVWDCPSAQRPTYWKPNVGYADYGYNAYGVGTYLPGEGLGLGGHLRNPSAREWHVPIRESEVIAPAETYALGDGLAGTPCRVLDGRGLIWRRWIEAEDAAESLKRSRRRHAGRVNIAFCDGHAEAISLEVMFFEEADVVLRRWNRDDLPHREQLNR